MSPIPVTHYFTYYKSLGGVQTMLRLHVKNDARFGLDSNVVAFFDPKGTIENGRVRGIGLSWRSTVGSARRAYRRELSSDERRPVAVYNNFWGLPFLADLDGSTRRIAALHSYYEPLLGECLSAEEGLVDGVLYPSEQMRATVRRFLPSLPPERMAFLPMPLPECPFPAEHQPLGKRPFVIGFSARLVNEQKRVDRLPEVVHALEKAGVDFRLELLGSGPQESWLKREFSGSPRVYFQGHLSGEAYWKVVAGWDGILFTSDFEGLPLSLLEAMSVGVLPIFPNIQSGGDDYVRRLDDRFVFELRDLTQVASIVSEVVRAGEGQVALWRARCREVIKPHLNDSYNRTYATFVRQISEAPRISASKFPKRRFYLTDHVPFALLVRTFVRGFYRRNDR